MENEETTKDNLKSLAKTSIFVFIALILSKVFTYVYRIIIARHYGPKVYGLLTLSLMITSWLIAFSSMGLSDGLIRYISLLRAKSKKKDMGFLFQKSLKLVVVATLVFSLLLLFSTKFISISIFHEPSLINFLYFFTIAISLTVILELFLSIILGYEKVGAYSFIYKVFIGFLRVFFLLVLINFASEVFSISLSYILSLVVTFIVTIFICVYKFPHFFKKVASTRKNNKLFSEMFSYSWPLLFYGFVWQIFHWTDSFMIGYFKTSTDVGVYNSAIQVAFLLTIASNLFSQLFFPMINREYSAKNYKMVKELSKQVGKWIFLIDFPIILLCMSFPGAFLNILFGSEYLPAANSLKILGIGLIFFSVFDVSNKLLSMAGKSKWILYDIIIVFFINLILNAIWIPRLGIFGAALSTSISFVVLSLIFGIQANYLFSIIPLRRKMLNLVFSASFSLLILFLLKSLVPQNNYSFLLLLTTFGLFYILLSFIFRAFDKNDTMILKSIHEKVKSWFNSSRKQD